MRAILFDLDGTLMDTPRVIVRSLRHALGSSNQRFTEAQLRCQIGRPLDSIIAELLPEADVDERAAMKQSFRETFRAETTPVARSLVFTEVPEMLTKLRVRDIKTAVVTSKITSSAVELLEAGRISRNFDAIIGHDQAASGKPAPDLAQLAASKLDVLQSDCVVVGDSPDDIAMGRSARMETIGVTWGIANEASLRAAGATMITKTHRELSHALFQTRHSFVG